MQARSDQNLGRLFNDSIVALDDGATSESADVPLVSTYEFDEAARDLHFNEYRKPADNPGVAALLKAPINAPVPIASFLGKRAFNSDPRVRAIFKLYGIDKSLLNEIKRDHIALSFINVFRRRSQPDFDSQERQALQILGQPLSKSLEIR